MFPIPPAGSEDRARLIAEHEAATDCMRGVAGYAVARTAGRGRSSDPHGGVMDDWQLARVLVRMRAMEVHVHGGKLVVICTKRDEEWRIGRLTGIRGVVPEFVGDEVFHDEQDAHDAIFRMRLDQYPERDGMPEHFNAGWKRRMDNWAVS
ncbi:MAG: hypothetical protein QOD81_1260 [Solirubrobacteraceae bacterium]|jgi:hypothetical protein|nr:hypothetical protein [Solirubrobacteraceae bacterium]